MYQDLTKFNHIYTYLLALSKKGSNLDYIECFRENFVFLDRKVEGEEDDSSITRKRLILLSNYADKLYQIEDYKEAEHATRKALDQFNFLTENERTSTNLYQLMLFNLAKIAYKLNDIDTSFSRFKRLYELYPEKGEYLKWLLMLNHHKKRKYRFVLVVMAGVLLAATVLLIDKAYPVLFYCTSILSFLCLVVIVFLEYKFFQTKNILEKKASL